jgi:hypothetical protein
VANGKRNGWRTGGLVSLGLSRLKDTGVLAMLAAATLISWLLIRNHNPAPALPRVAPVPAQIAALAGSIPSPASSGQSTLGAIAPVALSARSLKAKIASLGQPVFWAGAVAGARYELSRSSNGDVLVRYLPRGAKAGEPGPFLTVGTYPFPNAYATAQASLRQPGVRSRQLGGGAIASYLKSDPSSIYLAIQNVDYRIQVFDPSPAEARALVASGRVQPVG